MAVSLKVMTAEAIGSDTTPAHCQEVTLLGLNVINEATFLPRVTAAAPQFFYQVSQTARMGVFSVTAGVVTRAWVLLLPATGSPDRVMIGIPPGIGQAGDYYQKLDAANPLSLPLIRDYLALINGFDPYSGDTRNGKVQACYGSQVMGGGRPLAFLMPIRALRDGGGADGELGPFASDGAVITETITSIATATGNAFKPANIEVFTHSNGIQTCKAFLSAVKGRLPVRRAITIDPAPAQSIDGSLAPYVDQHLSGKTGGIVNGRPAGNFEFWPFDRWKNEPGRAATMKLFHDNDFDYLHNYALPRYLLRLSIRMSSG